MGYITHYTARQNAAKSVSLTGLDAPDSLSPTVLHVMVILLYTQHIQPITQKHLHLRGHSLKLYVFFTIFLNAKLAFEKVFCFF